MYVAKRTGELNQKDVLPKAVVPELFCLTDRFHMLDSILRSRRQNNRGRGVCSRRGLTGQPMVGGDGGTGRRDGTFVAHSPSAGGRICDTKRGVDNCEGEKKRLTSVRIWRESSQPSKTTFFRKDIQMTKKEKKVLSVVRPGNKWPTERYQS